MGTGTGTGTNRVWTLAWGTVSSLRLPAPGLEAAQSTLGQQPLLDWAVLDWGMAECADWVIVLQSGLEFTLANWTGHVPISTK